MKKATVGMVALCLLVAGAIFYWGAQEGSAQEVQQPKIQRVDPKIKKPPQICVKADLALWKDNMPLSPKDEFPFSTGCKACWEQIGIMNLPTMSVWVANKGQTNAPASKAKLVWQSGKAPYGEEQIVVNVPAIEAGNQTLLTVSVPQGKFFQTNKPVKLILDSANQVDECSKDNNTLTYTYR